MEMLTPDDVQAVLDVVAPGTMMHFFDSTTATSQQAADNIGCELGQIVKSLCFVIALPERQQPILVLASGDQRVDERKLAEWFRVGRKRVRIATAEECIAIYGYPPGSVPPFGHRTAGLTTFIDQSLARFEQLYAAGGAHNAIFPITLAQLVAATKGILLDVVRDANVPE